MRLVGDWVAEDDPNGLVKLRIEATGPDSCSVRVMEYDGDAYHGDTLDYSGRLAKVGDNYYFVAEPLLGDGERTYVYYAIEIGEGFFIATEVVDSFDEPAQLLVKSEKDMAAFIEANQEKAGFLGEQTVWNRE